MATLFFLLILGQAVIATTEQLQWQGRIHAKINGSTAENVWPLLEDFCNNYKIFPIDVSFCVEGEPGHIGQRRYMASKATSSIDGNATYISWEKHNLLAIDPIKRYITYEMMENNMKITIYRSTMKVLPDKHGSQIQWSYIAAPVEGFTSERFRTQLKWILQQAVKNIEKTFQST